MKTVFEIKTELLIVGVLGFSASTTIAIIATSVINQPIALLAILTTALSSTVHIRLILHSKSRTD